MKSTLTILGRCAGDDDTKDGRAECDPMVTAIRAFVGGCIGTAQVELWTSRGGGNRGGVVVRFTVKNDSSSMVPHAVIRPDGVDLHLCGDTETKALLDALRMVLRATP